MFQKRNTKCVENYEMEPLLSSGNVEKVATVSFQNLKGGSHHIWGCSLGSDFGRRFKGHSYQLWGQADWFGDLSSGISWPSG